MGVLLAAVVCAIPHHVFSVVLSHDLLATPPPLSPLSRCTLFLHLVINLHHHQHQSSIIIIIKFTAVVVCVWCGGGGVLVLVGAVVVGFVFWAVCCVACFVVAAVLFVRDIYIHLSIYISDQI